MKKSILSIFLIFASTCLWAETESAVQSLSAIQYKIESYMLNQLVGQAQGKIKVNVGKLDSRLKLRACADERLEIFNPYDSALLNSSTMGIKCTEETNHWTLYVPVRVTLLKEVLLNKRALRKGETLTDKDLYRAEMDAQKLKQGYYTDLKDLNGLVCKKDLPPDTIITPYQIESAKMVLKGQEVSIVAIAGSLKITMDGIALSDGVLGDVIKVKNTTSHKIIEAQVAGNKKVNVAI
ncbi:flagellar basal body P-ring formation chaperone FlgA [Legionella sp. km772]|uniref:flagellar basal body P-ring formation chaperone FlgA n=1 Tax=Legionella sp. km772 TaxID=2498111 RepID=UPI000F8D242E|nr:flagellar basal body P-ring formation chaperone FlgA [Legionella sp. km772]RUR11961.1 flagellar basal body P-ring formation protein FlgA [Legionella sp. km772]